MYERNPLQMRPHKPEGNPNVLLNTGSVPRLILDTRRARKEGLAAVEQRQHARFAEMVSFARTNSPYYQELYRDLPEHVDDPTMLPVTSKKKLMPRFNDWVTDPNITLEQAEAFVDNPDLIGQSFLDKYKLATTSGTTGMRGIFVIDEHDLNVTKALSLRMLTDWLDMCDIPKVIARGGKIAMLFATGGHFASAVASTNLRKGNWLQSRMIKVFPVHTPIPELVEQLNDFNPAVITSYASTMLLLTGEQEARRLHISPALITTTAEGVPVEDYYRMEEAFKTKVRNGYACTEMPFLSYSCEKQWYHVNTDWAVFEPIDEEYRPTPKGEQSHTVLISNLANGTQPILRYDLGDSVLERPDPCECGNPLPAIRVQGRSADILTFPALHGEQVKITPLTFGAVVDKTLGVELFQLVQTQPNNLRVRLRYASGASPDTVWSAVEGELKRVLSKNNIGNVTIERAEEPPEQSKGGKYREVIPLNHGK